MALYRHNSLLKIKQGICTACPSSVGKQPLQAKGLCQNHYQLSLKLKSLNKDLERDDMQDDGVAELKKELDDIFSRYVRMKAANSEGIAYCYICGKPERWQDCDNMHYIPRGSSFLRYDLRNTRCGCKECNQYKGGNLLQYGLKLDEEHLGITEVLLEESRMVYKYNRHELIELINHYTCEVLKLKSKFK